MDNKVITPQIKNTYQYWMGIVKHEMPGPDRPIVVIWDDGSSQCPNCFYDGVNNCSAGVWNPSGSQAFSGDFTCPVCSGQGTIHMSGEVTLSGTIYYPKFDKTLQVPGGKFVPASCEISMLISETIHNSGTYSGQSYFDFCQYVQVDGHKWIVDGVPETNGIGGAFIIDVRLERTNKVF